MYTYEASIQVAESTNVMDADPQEKRQLDMYKETEFHAVVSDYRNRVSVAENVTKQLVLCTKMISLQADVDAHLERNKTLDISKVRVPLVPEQLAKPAAIFGFACRTAS